MVGVHPKGGVGSEIDDSALGIVFDDGFSNMFIN